MLSKQKFKALWSNLVNAGIKELDDELLLNRVKLINFFCFIGVLILGFFGIYNFVLGSVISGYVELGLSLSFAIGILLLRFTKNVDKISSILLQILLGTLLYLFYTGGIEKTGIFWLYSFPAAAFFLKGKRNGWFWVISLFLLSADLYLLSVIGFIEIPYSFVTLRQVIISLGVLSFLIYLYESINEKSQRIIAKKEIKLEHEKEIDRAKTEFISLASHQLRTPLSTMKWTIDALLENEENLTSEQKKRIANLYSSNEKMIGLVDSLLNITRIESGRLIIDPKPTDIKKMTLSLESELKERIQSKKLNFLVNIGDFPDVNVDPKLIKELVSNLITNAIRYTQPGGEVKVAAYIKNNALVFEVSDNGYGISQKEQGKIFDKFFRGEKAVKIETEGSGLGLYLTKKLVKALHGNIEFKSVEGKGTTFWFEVPIKGKGISKRGEVRLNG